MSGEVVPGSSGATDLAEPAAGGQGGEVWLDQGRGAQDDFRDALAGEAGVAGHGVQDGGGELGGIGRLTRPSPGPRPPKNPHATARRKKYAYPMYQRGVISRSV